MSTYMRTVVTERRIRNKPRIAVRRIRYTQNRKYNREVFLQHKEEVITRQTSRYIDANDEIPAFDGNMNG